MTALRPASRLVLPLGPLAVGVLVLGPVLLHRGYLLVGDMTFVPDQPWKSTWLGLDGSVPRAVPADAVVSFLSHAIPGDLLQKAILLGIVVLAGVGVARLTGRVAGMATAARLGGAVLYAWNPYVFERLAIGHWGLLVGYAALPWALAAALDVRRDTPGAHGRLLLLLAVAAIGSPTGGLVTALVAIVVTAGRSEVRRTAVVVGSAVVVNLPWLAPALLNDTGASDSAGVAAFAARADTPLGSWGSLLTFGGIWKEAAAPGERDAALLAVAALVLVALSLGALVRLRTRADVLAPARLAVLALVALLLAGIPVTGAGERLVTDVVDAVPGAGIWRDSQKWLMPFVLVTCLGFVLLLDALATRMRRSGLPAATATVALALAPVALLPSLAWGLAGRYDAVHYPAEWQTVRVILEHQPAGDRRIAVLPWSAYQRLPWNDSRAALDPAIRYFPGQVITNEDLTISDRVTVAGEDATSAKIGRAITRHEPLGPVLAEEDVRYLLVEKTAPSAQKVTLPAGIVLHDGTGLTLLDLGNHGRVSRAGHRALIVTADVLAGLGILLGALLVIRRKADRRFGYHAAGSINGGNADTR